MQRLFLKLSINLLSPFMLISIIETLFIHWNSFHQFSSVEVDFSSTWLLHEFCLFGTSIVSLREAIWIRIRSKRKDCSIFFAYFFGLITLSFLFICVFFFCILNSVCNNCHLYQLQFSPVIILTVVEQEIHGLKDRWINWHRLTSCKGYCSFFCFRCTEDNCNIQYSPIYYTIYNLLHMWQYKR